jgi:hypothetical protein
MSTKTLKNTKKPKQINNRLTLTVDAEFEFILYKMKQTFPLLKDTDLVKMAVSGFVGQNTELFAREPDIMEKKAIEEFERNPQILTDTETQKLERELGVKLRNFDHF